MESDKRLVRGTNPIFPLPADVLGELSPRQSEEVRLARLEEAMVTTVARLGYQATTVSEVVGLARVSKSTFYQHFKDKEECFLATFERIVDQLIERLAAAFREGAELRGRAFATITAFLAFAVAQPEAMSLIVVDSLALGVAGFERREQASRRFEELVATALREVWPADVNPTLIAQAVVGGVRGVAYRRLRTETEQELPGQADALVDWVLSYRGSGGELARRAIEAAGRPAPPSRNAEPVDPTWDESPGSPLSRRTLTQRERLIRATAQLAHTRGFDSLSITAISGAAGVSNQTFYEHFTGKQDAFLAAFDALAAEVFSVTIEAFEAVGDRPEALGVGIRTLLEQIAGNPLFATLAFFELPAAGPAAFDRGDALLESFTAYLGPTGSLSAISERPPQVVLEAIGSAIWAVLLHELYHGRQQQLPDLAPEITRLAVVPIDPGPR